MQLIKTKKNIQMFLNVPISSVKHDFTKRQLNNYIYIK